MTDTNAPEAPFSHLSALDDLVLVADLVSSLKVHGIVALGADGHYAFHDPSTETIVTEARELAAVLKSHGVAIPPNVDKIIGSIGLLIPLLGLQA